MHYYCSDSAAGVAQIVRVVDGNTCELQMAELKRTGDAKVLTPHIVNTKLCIGADSETIFRLTRARFFPSKIDVIAQGLAQAAEQKELRYIRWHFLVTTRSMLCPTNHLVFWSAHPHTNLVALSGIRVTVSRLLTIPMHDTVTVMHQCSMTQV